MSDELSALDLQRAEVVLLGDSATDEQLLPAVEEYKGLDIHLLSTVSRRWGITNDRLGKAYINHLLANVERLRAIAQAK